MDAKGYRIKARSLKRSRKTHFGLLVSNITSKLLEGLVTVTEKVTKNNFFLFVINITLKLLDEFLPNYHHREILSAGGTQQILDAKGYRSRLRSLKRSQKTYCFLFVSNITSKLLDGFSPNCYHREILSAGGTH